MINRIRDVRRERQMTLADVAAACTPPTTAQTIGRLETGMRTLSLGWMNRIAAALGVEPGSLLAHDEGARPMIVARLTAAGAEALMTPAEAVLPALLGGRIMVLRIDTDVGDYRAGDLVWMREGDLEGYAALAERDVLAPLPAGRFAFGRLVDHARDTVTLEPPGAGRPVTITAPAWLAAAEMLVRRF